MSGGYFDYIQYRMKDIVDELNHIIETNCIENEFGYANEYSYDTLHEFKILAQGLDLTSIRLNRVDWLLSGDDGEQRFHERLAQEIEKWEEDNKEIEE